MATLLFHDRSPGEIASNYDISLAEVYAALAYYYQHKPKLGRHPPTDQSRPNL